MIIKFIKEICKKMNLVVKKNRNLNLYTTKDDKYFTQQLEIYNKFLLLSTELSVNYIHNKNE